MIAELICRTVNLGTPGIFVRIGSKSRGLSPGIDCRVRHPFWLRLTTTAGRGSREVDEETKTTPSILGGGKL